MSGSYGILNQKYNLLLALIERGTGSETLSQVLTNGNTANNNIILENIGSTTITPESVVIEAGDYTSRLDTDGLSISDPSDNIVLNQNSLTINTDAGDNQFLFSNAGHLEWKTVSIPSGTATVGRASILSNATSGEILFGVILNNPVVNISQLSNNLVLLGITSISNTSFFWQSSSANVGIICWNAVST